MSGSSHPLEPSINRLENFSVYETNTYYYLIGFNNLETEFQLLKINKYFEKAKDLTEILYHDRNIYTKDEIFEILEMINEGNKLTGGLLKICSAIGLVGFVKFLDCYYFTVITQRKEVACIGGNYIYSVKNTEMFAIKPKGEPEANTFKKIWKKLIKY